MNEYIILGIVMFLLIVNIAISAVTLSNTTKKLENWADGFGGSGGNDFKTFSGCSCIGAALKNNKNMTNDSALYADNKYQHF